MSPKLVHGGSAKEVDSVSLGETYLSQACVQSSFGTSKMSDISTTEVVFFQNGDGAIISNGGNAVLGSPDANTS